MSSLDYMVVVGFSFHNIWEPRFPGKFFPILASENEPKRALSSLCTTVFRLRWMEEGQRDVGWRVTARVQPPTNFNIPPSPPLPSINSLMETEKEGNIIGGKMPRSPWPEAGWGLHWGRGRRQHPGRTFVALFPAAFATLLLGLHKSLSAAFSRGIPTFSQGCAQLAKTLALCQMTQSSAIASLICPFPGLWYFASPRSVCHPLSCLLSRSSVAFLVK